MCSHLKDITGFNAGLHERPQPVIMVCRHCLRRTISRCCPEYLYTDDEELLLKLVVTSRENIHFHAYLRVTQDIKSVLYVIDAPDVINVCDFGRLERMEAMGAEERGATMPVMRKHGIALDPDRLTPAYH